MRGSELQKQPNQFSERPDLKITTMKVQNSRYEIVYKNFFKDMMRCYQGLLNIEPFECGDITRQKVMRQIFNTDIISRANKLKADIADVSLCLLTIVLAPETAFEDVYLSTSQLKKVQVTYMAMHKFSILKCKEFFLLKEAQILFGHYFLTYAPERIQ